MGEFNKEKSRLRHCLKKKCMYARTLTLLLLRVRYKVLLMHDLRCSLITLLTYDII